MVPSFLPYFIVRYNGVATKAPPIITMTLLANTLFVLNSTSFYKSTLNKKPTLSRRYPYEKKPNLITLSNDCIKDAVALSCWLYSFSLI